MPSKQHPKADRRARPPAGPALVAASIGNSFPLVPPAGEPDPAELERQAAMKARYERTGQREVEMEEARLDQIRLENDRIDAEVRRIGASVLLSKASARAEKGRAFMFGCIGVAALAFAFGLLLTGGAS